MDRALAIALIDEANNRLGTPGDDDSGPRRNSIISHQTSRKERWIDLLSVLIVDALNQ